MIITGSYWANANMIAGGPKRLERIAAGETVWISNSRHGIKCVQVLSFDLTFAWTSAGKIRLSETSFYKDRPR